MAASKMAVSSASGLGSLAYAAPRPSVPTRTARLLNFSAAPVGSTSLRFVAAPHPTICTAAAVAEPAMMDMSFASLMDEDEFDDDQEVIEVDANQEIDDTLKVENLGLSPETINALAARGITALFPIQKSVFLPAMEGRDMTGRAKTGSGKTLAFTLPVVENLLQENRENPGVKRGRLPRAIVLAPTRELANQVAREFESVCPSLKVDAFYGGVNIMGNMRTLRDGLDVVVGTPGRVIDLIDRGALKLDKVRYAILDEADQMLDMGFEEDMEKILSYVPEERQTLLFSATMPKWVSKIARRYQKNPLMVDLVGEENTGKLPDTVRLLAMQVEHSQKTSALIDAIQLHAAGGKAIVFVNTKLRADEIAERLNETTPCMALHGDIAQAQRDRALQQFREGKFTVMVATDVAARGLDIPDVDLVVHYDVPQDTESFLHRSGRTGRANNKGTALVLFTDREARVVGNMLKSARVTNAEMCGSPDPADVMTATCRTTLSQLDKVDAGVIEFFLPAAEKLLSSDQPARVLAAALANMSGFRRPPQPRSMLTYEEGLTTLRISGGKGTVDSWKALTATLKAVLKKAGINKDLENCMGKIKFLGAQDNGKFGAAFDVPVVDATLLLEESVAEAANAMGYNIDKPRTLALDINDLLVGGRGGGSGPGRSGGWSNARGSGGDRGGFSRGGDRGGFSRGGDRGGFSKGGDRGSFGGGGGKFGGERGGYGGDRAFSRSGSGGKFGGAGAGGGFSGRNSFSKGGYASGSADSGSFYDAGGDDYFEAGASGGKFASAGGYSSKSSAPKDFNNFKPKAGSGGGSGSAAGSKAKNFDDGWASW